MAAKTTTRTPVAFMSYVQFVDKHDRGRLTEFRERLSAEVEVQTGKEFPIFQDRNDIKWGQNWRERIDESLDAVTFLIPILTPSFFESPACRDEMEKFLEREKKLKRNDLILPVYYVDCPLLNEEDKRKTDPLAETIAARQFFDWRDLRFEPFTSPQIGKALAQMAVQIRDALERTATATKTSAKRAVHAPKKRGKRKAPDAMRPSEKAATLEQRTPDSEAGKKPKDRGLAPKIEIPTHVVDAMHRGDFATISEAIEAANPGDRILVRPGLYDEGLVIDKPLEILGHGEPGEIVIQAAVQDCVLFRATMGRIANLVLRQLGGDEWYCVDISRGRLVLEDCDITSQSLACVGIHGGADPRLRGNRIHDGKQAGVVVYETAQGTLEDNDIFGNALSGVMIKDGGNPVLRRNRIHDGKQAGVFVYENAQGTLEDNDIFANANSGVAISEDGNPVLRRNRIHKNGFEAIWIWDNGGGVFEDNDLRDNARGAWDISDDSKKNVTRDGNQE